MNKKKIVKWLEKLSEYAYRSYFADRNDISKYHNIMLHLNNIANLFGVTWETLSEQTTKK